jgi:hypothetical protein
MMISCTVHVNYVDWLSRTCMPSLHSCEGFDGDTDCPHSRWRQKRVATAGRPPSSFTTDMIWLKNKSHGPAQNKNKIEPHHSQWKQLHVSLRLACAYVLADDGYGVSTRKRYVKELLYYHASTSHVWCWEFWFTYRDLELISCLLGYVIYFLS